MIVPRGKRIITPADRRLCSLAGTALSLGAAGVVARTYATWNPADKHAGMQLSENKLTATEIGFLGSIGVRSTIGKSSGKWYWEIVTGGSNGAFKIVGASQLGHTLSDYLGISTNGWGYEFQGDPVGTGRKINGNEEVSYGADWVSGDVIGVALNMDAHTIGFDKNGQSQGIAFSNLSGAVYAHFSPGGHAQSGTANFGASTFAYPVPAGYQPGLYL